MREVVIVSAARTPTGTFGGKLASFSAVELGRIAAESAIARAGISKDIIDEVVIGNVLSAGLGQNPARQVAIKAGLPTTVNALTINKVCGSGLRAITLAAQMIKAHDADVVLAGGMESMSNTPYLLPAARFGYRMGHNTVVDSMINDGLWEAFHHYHMGVTAENIARKWNITRAEQDEYAAESQRRAEEAIKAGKFRDEIVPVTVPQKKGEPIVFDTDEPPRFGTTVETLAKLKPAFEKGGTVTAGNSSGINDGAAMLLIMAKEKADELGLSPLAKIISYGSAGVEPEIMGIGPVHATQKTLAKAGLTVDDVSLIEANEAFAVQALAVMKELKLDPAKTNVNGGAIALGHPIGASGARITTTLLYEMKKRKVKYGLATLCIGGGLGTALLVESCRS